MNPERLNRGFASAAKYCSSTERAPKQVKDKLLSWAFTEEETEAILERLESEQFIDEMRFARAYCRDKFEFNHWGNVKIRMEISRYGVSKQALEEGLAAISEEKYEQKLLALAQQKWKLIGHKGDAYLQKRKLADFLMRKGYEGDLVWRQVNIVTENED